jgi:hypothetical protein
MHGKQHILITGKRASRKVIMPAYNRGEASLESYLVKIIAALCRERGGEIRVKGELIDVIDQPVTLLKSWDSSSQELVLRTTMGSFTEVYRVIPEKQPTKEVIAADPLKKEPEQSGLFPVKGSTLDDEKLQKLERDLTKRRIARMVAEDLRQKQRQPEV